jgi:hypothetical protein
LDRSTIELLRNNAENFILYSKTLASTTLISSSKAFPNYVE